jgi:eukaryotic-like serine/threonine-protein kinase
VTVPSLLGRDQEVAAGMLQADHLHVSWRYADGGATRGRVIAQYPRPRARLAKSGTVVLTVTRGPAQLMLPDVTRQAVAAAEGQLRQSGFEPQVVRSPSATVPPGLVATTSPPPFSRVFGSQKIVLVVSAGAPKRKVPNVRGALLAAAQRRLTAAGLHVQVDRRPAPGRPGSVLTQTPPAGAQVQSGSVVTVVVAAPLALISVPNVVGKSDEDAAATVSALGLSVSFTNRVARRKSDEGHVIAQNPAAGRRVPRASKVGLTVAVPPPVTTPERARNRHKHTQHDH